MMSPSARTISQIPPGTGQRVQESSGAWHQKQGSTASGFWAALSKAMEGVLFQRSNGQSGKE
jgi:hypothetical protein